MLLVLSEIECLDYLNSVDVYPDIFFTDFKMFKNMVVGTENADIVILLAGTCRFSKRLISELATQLMNRAKSETDGGIRSVCVMSDTDLRSIPLYYKYDGRPFSFLPVENGKIKKTPVDLWSRYKSEPKETTVYLVRSALNELAENIQKRHDKDDDLLEVIQTPEAK